MDIIFEELDLEQQYDFLSKEIVKINQNYQYFINLYDELNLASDLLLELNKQKDSPIKSLKTMEEARQLFIKKLSELKQKVTEAQSQLTQENDTDLLQDIANDSQVLLNLLDNLQIKDLQEMFEQLINSEENDNV